MGELRGGGAVVPGQDIGARLKVLELFIEQHAGACATLAVCDDNAGLEQIAPLVQAQGVAGGHRESHLALEQSERNGRHTRQKRAQVRRVVRTVALAPQTHNRSVRAARVHARKAHIVVGVAAQRFDAQSCQVVRQHVGHDFLAAHDDGAAHPRRHLVEHVARNRHVARLVCPRGNSGLRLLAGSHAFKPRTHVIVAKTHLPAHTIRRQLARAGQFIYGVPAYVQDACDVLHAQRVSLGKAQVGRLDALRRQRLRLIGDIYIFSHKPSQG